MYLNIIKSIFPNEPSHITVICKILLIMSIMVQNDEHNRNFKKHNVHVPSTNSIASRVHRVSKEEELNGHNCDREPKNDNRIHMQDTNITIHTSTNTAATLKLCHQFAELEDPSPIQNRQYVELEMGTNPQRKDLHTAETSETNLDDTLAPIEDNSMAETATHSGIGLTELDDTRNRLESGHKPKQTTCNTAHQTNVVPNTCTRDVIDTTSDATSRNKHTRAGVHFFYQRTLECDNAGLDHTIHGHNITIRIPEGAVPPGDKLLMKVGVTLFGPFTFPENFWPISPLLQLCPSEIDHYEFKKPLTVILPHFLSEKTIEKLTPGEVCFTKANHNYSEENGYKFELIDTKPMFATSGSRNFGVLQIQHCCYLCLQKGKNLEGAKYNLVKIERPLQQRGEIHFLVTYFLDTCLQALDEQYPPDTNNCEHKPFQFASDNLQISICTDHSDYVIASDPKSQRVSGYASVYTYTYTV